MGGVRIKYFTLGYGAQCPRYREDIINAFEQCILLGVIGQTEMVKCSAVDHVDRHRPLESQAGDANEMKETVLR